MINQLRRKSFTFRSLVAREPSLWFFYQPYLWWGQMKQYAAGANYRERIINSDTELVIDGFQGSANSSFTRLFKDSQTYPVTLAHHMHSPAQIIQGCRKNIPILLTIREPVGSVISLTRRWPYISASQGLQSYISFYSKLKPYTSHFVVSSFLYTTQHQDCVVKAINTKFNTQFDLVDIVRAKAKHDTKVRSQDSAKVEKIKAIKQEKRKELAAERNSYLLSLAESLYEDFNTLSQKNIKIC